ncbi:hypothetical protein CTEN210_18192 [Chaetoceros tenuissimus]|uniref:HSF-type DNA-binding domain-containing protein n=1 Tax=Chaetoceros tenuissimus TaxID=426638 RepID=A0AAD3DEA9_9STRA|nr:hypothetical protein CTEN210_18192 [Chaetoceros tenuissimus]
MIFHALVSPYQGYIHCYDYHEPLFPISGTTGNSRSIEVSPNKALPAAARSNKFSVDMQGDTDSNVPVICTKGGVKAPFPVKLMDLLNLIDTKEPQLASIISWQPSGESFKVRDKKRFEKEVQSLFFTQTNYTSFRRQLNLWGFKRIDDKHSEDCGAYLHPMFKRNDMYACRLMRRPGKESSSQASFQSTSKAKTKSKATKEARRVSLSCNRSQDNDLNFIVNDNDSNPIILEDEFEPIVDEEKECVLPHEVVVLFLAHALMNSDCL